MSKVGCSDIRVGDGGARKVSFNLVVPGHSLKEAFEKP